MFWFKKKSKINIQEDKVWSNSEIKYNSIVNEAISSFHNQKKVCIIAYFDETKEAISELFENKSIPIKICHDLNTLNSQLQTSRQQIALLHTNKFSQNYDFPTINLNSNELSVHFIFAEHYPLFSKEELLLNQLNKFFDSKSEYIFHVSFDDELMKIFGAERIHALMQSIGIKEDECIQHSFVTKAFINAQKKIEKNIQNDFQANSQTEWFKKNYKKKF